MKRNYPTRKLREHSDINQLKRQAKELLKAYLAGDADAADEVHAHYRRRPAARFALHDAQLVLARSYGFDSWPKLKAYVDGATIQRLGELVRADDLAAVQALLKTRPELANMEMSYGNEHRPLHYAVMNRSPEMVRLLLQHGAESNRGIHPRRDETTALRLAIDRGYDDIVAIIEKEEQRPTGTAAVDALDDLRTAIADGDAVRVDAILQTDPALAHARDRAGRTPLDLAAVCGRNFSPLADVLRRNGAEITPRAMVALGDADGLRVLHAEGMLVNPITWDIGGLLTVAVRNNRRDILSLLLAFGLDPDERARSGDGAAAIFSQGFPLWHCAALGHREMAELLLHHGANPNVGPDSSGSAVYSAYSHRQWEMVELLRQHGGVVGAGTAAIYRQTELVRQMLEDEARGTLAQGVTSGRALAEDLLDFGASGGADEIVRLALERIDWPRADPRWFWFLQRPLDFWNHIPWLYAGNKELDRGTYFECFRQILGRCDANVIGGFTRTVLHEVAAIGDHVTDEEATPFAIALLDAGARMDARDEIFRSTPLGWACRWGRAPIVKVLLERGADPVEADAEPWARPEAWAEKMGHAGIAALLRG